MITTKCPSRNHLAAGAMALSIAVGGCASHAELRNWDTGQTAICHFEPADAPFWTRLIGWGSLSAAMAAAEHEKCKDYWEARGYEKVAPGTREVEFQKSAEKNRHRDCVWWANNDPAKLATCE